MHIHWIANFITPPPRSLSGGDRIMVECLRRWSKDNRVTVYGGEPTRQLCDYMGLDRVEHSLWPGGKWAQAPRIPRLIAETAVARREAGRLTLPNNPDTLVVSSSDFPPDTFPALMLKQRFPQIAWAGTFYLFAPPLIDYLSGKPTPGLSFCLWRPMQQYVLNRLIRHADMILTTGEEDRQIMLERGRRPESVFPIRGGVDLSIPRQVPEPATKDFDAVFIGRVHPQKGPLELLDIWKLVLEQRKGARLAIIGSGPLEVEAKAKAARLGLGHLVEFFGFRDGIDKYRIVKSARVVVHPAVYEVGGMAAAEALACGLPGVSFDLPALRTYYPKGFLKTAPGDFRGFADLILKLLTDEELYRSMSAEALVAGMAWDWDARAEEVLSAIKRGVATRPN